ncbi:MAG: hypothetical protein EAX81_02995 [Candidatus Thorarchaeota archaeon]|nr:hypothetical protein [Candidatus Thorarchaeota archaeon]
MDVDRIQHILTSLMILSFLIFGGLSIIILITNAPLSNGTVALPFAFLFVSMMTLITTGLIEEKPTTASRHVNQWLILCAFMVFVSALVFIFS